ncbi:MAG: hypothetical protein WB592_04765, partial [Acidimicrobiales bacterium]
LGRNESRHRKEPPPAAVGAPQLVRHDEMAGAQLAPQGRRHPHEGDRGALVELSAETGVSEVAGGLLQADDAGATEGEGFGPALRQ